MRFFLSYRLCITVYDPSFEKSVDYNIYMCVCVCVACIHVYLFVFDTQTDYRVGDNRRERCVCTARNLISDL